MTNAEREILEAELYKLSYSAQKLMKKFFAELNFVKNALSKIQDLPHEIWRDVVGYEGLYQVSNLGRLKSLHYGKSVILNPSIAKDGYRNVTLTRHGSKKYRRLHILVAQAFIPNPDNLPVVHHRDGNKSNNRADNLMWTTHSKNTRLAYEAGLAKSGCQHFRAKLTAEEVRQIRESYVPYSLTFGISALARRYKVNYKTIRKVVYGISYREVGGAIHKIIVRQKK